MSLASIVSSALEVSGLKDYVGHAIGGLTGWLLEKAYCWWTGRNSRSAGNIDMDIRDVKSGHHWRPWSPMETFLSKLVSKWSPFTPKVTPPL